jgi:hypothetical protein
MHRNFIRFDREGHVLTAYQTYRQFVDKSLQTRGNQVCVSAIIELNSHAYPRTLNLFEDIC